VAEQDLTALEHAGALWNYLAATRHREPAEGDIDRIQQYPARGFQVAHPLPDSILASWRALIQAGFGRHLLTAG
jgi:hypothetical protein